MSHIKTHINKEASVLFLFFMFTSIVAVLAGLSIDNKLLLAAPFGVLMVLWGLRNFKSLYFFLLFLIPLSVEFDVSPGLSTDLPTEPLMVGMFLLSLFYLARNAQKIDFSFFRNTIAVLLFLHISWMLVATIFSTVPLFSIKFLLAKAWYIASFFITTAIVINSKEDVKKAFWCIFIPLIFTVVYTMINHARTGFAFDAINFALRPFYRNHVNYAAILVVFFPFIWYARTWYKKYSATYNILLLSALLVVAAIYFSYTRACQLALISLVPTYFIIRFRLTKVAVAVCLIGVVFVAKFITFENHYLQYTPTTKTVSQVEFGDLIDATFKAEDVSSMERIYRWIAAIHMINDKPVVGFGPNGFVENYKNYTVFIFETWISENEEHSGVHDYFLMTAVEQGLVGLVLFVCLLIAFFLYAENAYRKARQHKEWIMAVALSMMAIVVNLLFSDMIEVDKTGSFFFMNLALIILLHRNFKGLMGGKCLVESSAFSTANA